MRCSVSDLQKAAQPSYVRLTARLRRTVLSVGSFCIVRRGRRHEQPAHARRRYGLQELGKGLKKSQEQAQSAARQLLVEVDALCVE